MSRIKRHLVTASRGSRERDVLSGIRAHSTHSELRSLSHRRCIISQKIAKGHHLIWPSHCFTPSQGFWVLLSCHCHRQDSLWYLTEIKGFLGLKRPFLDLVSQTPRPRGRGRSLFAETFPPLEGELSRACIKVGPTQHS